MTMRLSLSTFSSISLSHPPLLRHPPSTRRVPLNIPRAAQNSESDPLQGTDGPAPSPPSSSPPTSSSPSASFPYHPIATHSAIGTLETAYLTLSKLTGTEIVCPIAGADCSSVLSSNYASLWGVIPLSLAGMLAYASIAFASYAGYAAAQRGDVDREGPWRNGVSAGAVLLGTTSAYLMWVLFAAFPGELCPWCIGSASLSASILVLACSGLRRRELQEAMAPGAGLAVVTLAALTLGLGTPASSQAGTGITELEYKQPVVTEGSSPAALALASKLRAAGAKMYGAFWCSHCYEQKQIFGKEAMQEFPYVECFPEGWRQGVEMAPACTAAGLQGFPTWVIGSTRIEGAQTLETLEKALSEETILAPALGGAN